MKPRRLTCALIDESGTAAIEFGIGAMILFALSIGIVEFGRGLMLRNELGYAADVAARAALIDPDITTAEVQSTVTGAFDEDDASLAITFTSETAGGQQFRLLSISYPMTLLIPVLTDPTVTLTVTRRI